MPKLDKQSLLLRNQKGIAPIFLIAVIGIIAIILISTTFSFKNDLFSTLFPKKPSHAADQVFSESLNLNTLNSFINTHPKIFISQQDVTRLRTAIQTGKYKTLDNLLIAQANDMLAKEALPTTDPARIAPIPPNPNIPANPNDPNNLAGGFAPLNYWDKRVIGEYISTLSFAYLLHPDHPEYLEGAKRWAMSAVNIADCGDYNPTGGLPLAAFHVEIGLSTVYDWLYNNLDTNTKNQIKNALLIHGHRSYCFFKAASPGKELVNTYYEGLSGVATSGIVTYDGSTPSTVASCSPSVPVDPLKTDPKSWLTLTVQEANITFSNLADDGATVEGVSYWQYGTAHLVEYMDIARKILGADYFSSNWLKKGTDFAVYTLIPLNNWVNNVNGDGLHIDFSDSTRLNATGPTFLLRKLANEYNNSSAQWLADTIESRGFDVGNYRWLDMIWYNQSVVPSQTSDLTSLPTFKLFDNIGLAVMRSDWSGDESMVVFKNGPYVGHKALNSTSPYPNGILGGYGHSQLDANSFTIFGNGTWLFRDDGYTRTKVSTQHSTLVINGHGQVGEKFTVGAQDTLDSVRLARLKPEPQIFKTIHTNSLDQVSGDATVAYNDPNDTTNYPYTVHKYKRHLLYLKPNVLIVLDDVAVNSPQNLELRFFTNYPNATMSASLKPDGTIQTINAIVQMRFENLTKDQSQLDDCSKSQNECVQLIRGAEPDNQTLFPRPVLKLQANGKNSLKNATAISWNKYQLGVNLPKPKKVTLNKISTNLWQFTVDSGEIINFDWTTETASLITPAPTPTPTGGVPGDLNGDGVVNVIDYGIFAGDFQVFNSRSDFDHDGHITVVDYGMWVDYFRQANGIH